MPNRIDPPPVKSDMNNPQWSKWFSNLSTRFTPTSGASNPTVSQVPKGQWILYHNTTLNETRIWHNNNGTLVKSAAFT